MNVAPEKAKGKLVVLNPRQEDYTSLCRFMSKYDVMEGLFFLLGGQSPS